MQQNNVTVSRQIFKNTVYSLKIIIYADTYYLTNPVRLFYGRYVDDNGSFATSKEAAIQSCSMISSKDSEGRIKWEVEYPEDDQQYVPFLDTEIGVDKNNSISSCYYRKPQNKGITLNYKSHHQLSTKEAVARNYYKTAVDDRARTFSSYSRWYSQPKRIPQPTLLCPKK